MNGMNVMKMNCCSLNSHWNCWKSCGCYTKKMNVKKKMMMNFLTNGNSKILKSGNCCRKNVSCCRKNGNWSQKNGCCCRKTSRMMNGRSWNWTLSYCSQMMNGKKHCALQKSCCVTLNPNGQRLTKTRYGRHSSPRFRSCACFWKSRQRNGRCR